MFACQRCGECCRNLMINIAYSDITRWLRQGRFDILREVSLVRFKRGRDDGFYFGRTVKQGHPPCPFFIDKGKPACAIYSTRPRACKDFPIASKNAKVCPVNFKVSQKIMNDIRSKQFRDFKKAFIKRRKISNLLEIVHSFPEEMLKDKLMGLT